MTLVAVFNNTKGGDPVSHCFMQATTALVVAGGNRND